MAVYPPYQQPLLDRTTGLVSKPWQQFFLSLAGIGGPNGSGIAPADADYIVAAADPTLTDERVVVPSTTVSWDLATPGQVSAIVTAVPAHHPTHENGGSDELSVAGLSGLLADGQTPLAHALTHTATGSDPLPYLDVPEGLAAAPPADTARMYAVDEGGFTFPEYVDAGGGRARPLRDSVIVGKAMEPMTRGQLVYLSGATGANKEVRLAKADSVATMPALGFIGNDAAVNGFVRILLLGTLAGVNTAAYAEGARLWVSATVAGGVQTTPPVAPLLTQRVGFVTRAHADAGELLVLVTPIETAPAHHATHEPGGSDALTALDASTLTTGTVPDARLSANVALENAANVFTAPQQVSSSAPEVRLVETDQPSNQRLFRLFGLDQKFQVWSMDDALTTFSGYLALDRSGHLYLSGSVYEAARLTPMGHWQAVPFNAANFAGAAGMTWSVAAGHVLVNRYTLIGKTLIWSLTIYGSSLGGSASDTVYLNTPVAVLNYQHGTRLAWVVTAGTEVDARVAAYSTGAIQIHRSPRVAYALGQFDLDMTAILEL